MTYVQITKADSSFNGMRGELVANHGSVVRIWLLPQKMKSGKEWLGGTWLFAASDFVTE